MSNNPIFVCGQLEKATYTYNGTSSTDYPIENLSNYIAQIPWKGTVESGKQILIDLGSARAIDTAITEGLAFTPSGSNAVILQCDANDSSSFANPVTLVNLTTHAGQYYATFASITKRYFRVYFANIITTAPELSQIFLNTRFDLGFTQVWPYKAKDEEFTVTQKRSIGGILRTASPYNGGPSVFEVKFTAMPDTFDAAWKQHHQRVQGSMYPFYYIHTDGTVWYVNFENGANGVSKNRYNQNDTDTVRLITQDIQIVDLG